MGYFSSYVLKCLKFLADKFLLATQMGHVSVAHLPCHSDIHIVYVAFLPQGTAHNLLGYACPTLLHSCEIIQPSEPHLTRYIRERGFSPDDINADIYPVGTYAYFPWLLLLALASRLTSLRTAVLCGSSGRIGTRLLLLFATTKRGLQFMELFYSAGEAVSAVRASSVC